MHKLYYYVFTVTSDVQSVSATVVDESTIAMQCFFIHGSDALGCKVVLVSNCTNVRNIHTIITRSNSTMITSASRRLSLTHTISCYHKLHAFSIDINDTISNLMIEGIVYILMTDDEPAGNNAVHIKPI